MSQLRTLIRVDIDIDQEWAVGAAPDLWFRPDPKDVAEADRTTRLPVQRDPSGAFLLPATSLVGGLKRHLEKDLGEAWLGSGDVAGANAKTVPSALRTLAAAIHTDVVCTERRTTRIDPLRGAAGAGTLREEEVLSPGTVTWWLEWDHHDEKLDLDVLIERLTTWRPIVGRRRSADRGRAHVTAVYYRTLDLATSEGLTWWLSDRHAIDWASCGPMPEPEWGHSAGTTDAAEPLMTHSFQVVDGLHLGDGSRDGNISLCADVLRSTSWRGVFSHRIAHIVRVTTSGEPDQVDMAVADTVSRLFGSGRQRGASAGAGHRGILRFGDSPVTGTKLRRTHVAIDRVSGGAVQGTALDPRDNSGLLYEVEYYGPESTLTLTLFNDGPDDISETDQALIDHVIADIDAGVVGMGGLTTRGYGTLKSAQEAS